MFVPVRSCAPIRALSRIVLGLMISCCSTPDVVAVTFTVNSPADIVDANPGDGVCRTAPDNTVCTLRAAIMEANALPGADTIILQANVTYQLTRDGVDDTAVNGDLDVLDSVTIVGAGPTSTILDANGGVTKDRAMQVFTCVGNTPASGGSCPGSEHVLVDVSGVAFRNGQVTTGTFRGGGITNDGMLTLDNCVIAGNGADTTFVGGGIYNSSGTLTLNNSTVANNTLGTSSYGGAGIASFGPMTIINSTISGNVVAASLGYGGGILNGDVATVIGSTISGNHAVLGGGISSRSGGSTLNLINTTISANSSDGSGGGLAAGLGTIVGLYNVTITGNQANADAVGLGDGGGVLVTDTATVTVSNSIISNNYYRNEGSPFDTFDECSGALTLLGDMNNIVTFRIAAHCPITGTYKPDAASLGPLQGNGGPTSTHALLVGSEAIDHGNPSGCTDNLGAFITTDQRGVHRPNGAVCDLGAYEFDNIIFQNGFNS
jgi:CSLREA domain-containing protein